MSMRITVFILAVLLAACAAGGPLEYGPAQGGKFGYSETKLEEGRYRVSYQGSGGTPPDIVEAQALRRAAELTLENDYEWFRVVNRDLEGEQRGGVSIGGGVGSSRFGRPSSVGVGVGGNFGTIGAQAFHTARLEIWHWCINIDIQSNYQ